MDRAAADLNIAYFKRLLKTGTDPAKRQTIERLLTEEEAKAGARPSRQGR